MTSGSGSGDQGSAGRIVRMAGEPPSPAEVQFEYSRTVQFDGLVLVGGTTSVDEYGMVIGTTPYEQAVEILGKLEHELSRAGAQLSDVVQLRVYVTDISRGAEVGRAHADVFGEIRPVMTMVEVSGLFDPRMLVEIEAVARSQIRDH